MWSLRIADVVQEERVLEIVHHVVQPFAWGYALVDGIVMHSFDDNNDNYG